MKQLAPKCGSKRQNMDRPRFLIPCRHDARISLFFQNKPVAGHIVTYRGRTLFRTTARVMWMYVVLSVALLACALLTTYYDEALWITLFCWGMFAFSFVAIVDAAYSYVRLDDESVQIRRNFYTTRIARADVETVAVEKGCPVLLLLKDGTKVEVPGLGTSAIGNSLRAWLRAA